MFANITREGLFQLTKDDVSKALAALKADADFAGQKQLVDKSTQVEKGDFNEEEWSSEIIKKENQMMQINVL